MGTQQIIYGFIEIDEKCVGIDEGTIKEFEDDKKYPLVHLLSGPFTGYRGATISFASSVKSLDNEEWIDWVLSFENLLRHLHARTAVVNVIDEDDGDVGREIHYLCDDGWKEEIVPLERSWLKWTDRHCDSTPMRFP